MKKLALLLVLIVITALSAMADYYKVTASTLNLRSQPNSRSGVVAVVNRGETVEVSGINGKWATVDYGGRTTYAFAKYLTPTSAPAATALDTKVEKKGSALDAITGVLSPLQGTMRHDSVIWLYISIGLVACFAAVNLFADEDFYFDEEAGFTVGIIGFLVLSVCEIIYFLGYTGNPIWFCTPDSVGWLWTVINFLLFGFATYTQLMAFITIMGAAHYHGERRCDNRIGFICTLVAIGAMIVTGIFWGEYFTTVACICFLGLLAWLGWMTYTNVRDEGSWINLGASVALWMLGMLATLIVVAHFLVLLIIVLIGLLILSAIGHGSSQSSSSSSSSSSSYTPPSNDEEERHFLRDQYGNEKEVELDMFGTTAHEKGNPFGPTYHKTAYGWEERD